jgi:hypothetical protein
VNRRNNFHVFRANASTYIRTGYILKNAIPKIEFYGLFYDVISIIDYTSPDDKVIDA